jgi:hypothetical protein
MIAFFITPAFQNLVAILMGASLTPGLLYFDFCRPVFLIFFDLLAMQKVPPPARPLLYNNNSQKQNSELTVLAIIVKPASKTDFLHLPFPRSRSRTIAAADRTER